MNASHFACPSDGIRAGTQRFSLELQAFERLEGQETAAPLGFIDLNASVCSLAHGVAWQAGRCHYHHGYELHLLIAPHRGAYVGGEFHRLAAGSIVLIGPRLPHNLAFVGIPRDSERTRSLTLRFADEPLRKSMEFLPELREAQMLLDLAHQGVEFHGLDGAVVERFQRIRNLRGLERFAEFAALLNELSRWKTYRTLAASNRRRIASEAVGRAEQIYRVLDFINDNYMQELTLSEVGAVAKMSANAFSRYFRQATGNTFTEAVISLRIAKACQLLLHTRKQIGSICYEVGFNNISNFNRHFRALRGASPRQYRASGENEGVCALNSPRQPR